MTTIAVAEVIKSFILYKTNLFYYTIGVIFTKLNDDYPKLPVVDLNNLRLLSIPTVGVLKYPQVFQIA